jgi:CheY-like chemotaxis protein
MAAPSLLIVEDHDELRTTIEALLRSAGYHVVSARNADEALEALRLMPRPCLVLWDPVTHRISLSLLAESALEGIHVATIPVGIAPTEAHEDTSAGFSKRLTSQTALMSIVREHCTEPT